jgi:membrane-associated phospholipid phosphatase
MALRRGFLNISLGTGGQPAGRGILGVHYPSDVLAGLTLGSALLFWWRDPSLPQRRGRRLAVLVA